VERLVASDKHQWNLLCSEILQPQALLIVNGPPFRAHENSRKDFMIRWDTAYAAMTYPGQPIMCSIFWTSAKGGDPDRVMIFASTSKISYAAPELPYLRVRGEYAADENR
jgi:hypothetical protein